LLWRHIVDHVQLSELTELTAKATFCLAERELLEIKESDIFLKKIAEEYK
jgi:hypothetical protein